MINGPPELNLKITGYINISGKRAEGTAVQTTQLDYPAVSAKYFAGVLQDLMAPWLNGPAPVRDPGKPGPAAGPADMPASTPAAAAAAGPAAGPARDIPAVKEPPRAKYTILPKNATIRYQYKQNPNLSGCQGKVITHRGCMVHVDFEDKGNCWVHRSCCEIVAGPGTGAAPGGETNVRT